MTNVSKTSLWGDLDFQMVGTNPDFKEDSVREVIVHPLLLRLGYNEKDIIRSKKLVHPFIRVGGSKQQRNITHFPDYILQNQGSYAWVLDAKSPGEMVTEESNIEQVYLYSSHPAILAPYFALCNGIEFCLYRREGFNKPVLYFSLKEIEHYWEKLSGYLAPSRFSLGKTFSYSTTPEVVGAGGFDYSNRPLLGEIPGKKQSAKRHFGVHGYFTKQTWNVVRRYIENYTKPGDLVLDPYGGTGVTAIEALMRDRRAINIDLNPLAVFIVKTLISPVNFNRLTDSYIRVREAYLAHEPKTEAGFKKALKAYPHPKGYKLPRGSDVDFVEELFSTKQLAQLSCLKYFILQEQEENIRNALLLMFSGLLTKVNLTYHNNPNRLAAGRGNAAPFAYYRYRMAKEPVDVDLLTYFGLRFKKVVEAKKEIAMVVNERNYLNANILKGTATNLDWIPNESVDYIYTDPPYGKKIQYLDLSIMWNAWLDIAPDESDYKLEAIVGGEHKKSKDDYNKMIAESIREMYRVLKFDRWLSFVFAHKDPEFWHLIMETAEQCGFEYVGAVPQKNGQSTFKKRQNPFTVLSGQLIINFKKTNNPRAILKYHLGMDTLKLIIQTIEGIIAKNNGATLEQINDELILKGMELGFLDLLKKQYDDLTPILSENFTYDEKTQLFTIKEDSSFQTHIDVELRIRYYLISYLTRMQRENKNPTFDEIVLNIMPLLKNGHTPEHQTISNVLAAVGEHIGSNMWKLKTGGQMSLLF